VCEGKGFTLASGADAVGTSPVTYTWYENGVPISSSNTASLGVPAGRAVGTYAYVRMASNDDCALVPSNTYTVQALAPPAKPTGASANSRCGAGGVTFSATVPAGVTIDWYTTATGGTLVSGGSGVTSFRPSINASTTYYAEARHINAGCGVSAARLAVTGTVTPRSQEYEAVHPTCGCAAGLYDCNGMCKGTTGNFTKVDCITDVTSTQREGSGLLVRNAAITACANKGKGWRLPTYFEMLDICKYKDEIPGGYLSGTTGIYAYWCIDTFEGQSPRQDYRFHFRDCSALLEVGEYASNTFCVR
jgi:hypothetical protein